MAPLVARSFAEWTLIPLGVLAMLAMFVVIMAGAAARSGLRVGWRFAPRVLR
jgi:hypothetical protein